MSGSHPRNRGPDEDWSLPPPTTLECPPNCVNKNSTPAFYVICSHLKSFQLKKGDKFEDFQRLYALWRERVGNDLYPLIRLLLPDRDRERPVYNLKESLLARSYVEVLGLDKNSPSAQRMIKWKQPINGEDLHCGDFARACYNEIKARSTVEQGRLTVEAVNIILDRLAKATSKQKDIVPILRSVNSQCTAVEQEWIIRIILKELHIAARERVILGAFHPDAIKLFNVCSDLKRICWTLYTPEIRIDNKDTKLEPFHSFRPQLCFRYNTSSHDAVAKLVGAPKEFIMEEKLDGERIQLHMRGNGTQWFYCSRKAKDYTAMYGAHPGEGSLTKYITDVFQDGVRNIILDGEMMVWDPMLEKYLAFGTLKTAAKDFTGDANSPRPCFVVFDMLYLNDHCLTETRLSERKRILRGTKVFKNLDRFQGRIELVNEKVGKTGKDISEFLERILKVRGEGLVVKKTEGAYKTDYRGPNWVKVKPEYADQMGEILDVLVVGGWWGKGGRSGKISRLLCGLRLEQEDDGSGERPTFRTFCSIGSGMSFSDYNWILNNQKAHWKQFSRQSPPSWLQLGQYGNDDKPDVYIEPENSFVIKVKASEIIPAGKSFMGGYGMGFTLRFPRCTYIFQNQENRDYSLDDESKERDMWNCLSVDEFQVARTNPAKRYADNQGGPSTQKKRKTNIKKTRLITNLQGQKISEDAIESELFGGMTFYVPKGTASHPKSVIEALIFKHGGQYMQAQSADLSALVISPDQKSPLVRAQIKKGVSVIKPDWVLECVRKKKVLPYIKEFMVHASEGVASNPFYNKTLDEVASGSFVRDQCGQIIGERMSDGSDDGDDFQELGEEGAQKQEKQKEEQVKSEEQKRLEALWGIRPSSAILPSSYPSSSQKRSEEQYTTDSDSGSERRERYGGDDNEDDKYSQDSEIGDDEVNTRLFPVHGIDIKPEDAMGAEPDAMEYDDDKIFYHLVFYLDTEDNAISNGLEVTSPLSDTIIRLAKAEHLLRENGGRIVSDINDPKITHIIMDDEDSKRYAEIASKTAQPKRKHIVLPSWVDECVDEETLRSEEGRYKYVRKESVKADFLVPKTAHKPR